MKRLMLSLGAVAMSYMLHAQGRINITPDMITDEKAYPYSSPYKMFDEQSTISSETLTAKPVTRWGDHQEETKYYPLSAVIDLKAETTIGNIYIYDYTGKSSLSFYSKSSTGAWELLFTDNLDGYGTWNKHAVNKKTRYVRVVSAGPGGTFNEVVMFGAASVVPPVDPPVIPGTSVKLKIRPDMIIDEKAYPHASPWRMFDEQSSISAEPPVGSPSTFWGDHINKELFYPLSAIVDLGQEITLSNIYINDLGGSSNLSFYAKTPAGWELLFTDPLTGYGSWNKRSVSKKTRYVRIVSDSPNGNFAEVVMYGDKQTIAPTYSVPATTKEYPLLEDFLGLNLLHIHSAEKASIVKNIREFHLWTWNEANMDIANYAGFPNNQYGFQPSPGNNWKFDDTYKNFKNKGMRITPTLQGTAFWFAKSTDGSIQDNKPLLAGKNPEDPMSYAAHADYLYQFAARYGSKQVPVGNLKLQANNPAVSGLNTIDAVENWNEPNKTWKTRAGMFTPYEYAALASADYDGHQGKLGLKAGVKNADPNLPMVMAGLIGMDSVYTRAMLHWFKQNRTDNKYPFDVINYHHYSNDAGGQVGAPSYGLSPEADGLEKKVKDIVGFNRKYMPEKPIWITEFGYDVSQVSPQKAKTYGAFTGEDIQAMWLIRSFMAIYAGGADRAYMFWMVDDNSANNWLFGTCGLFSQIPPAAPQPRKSYFWLSTLSKVLGKYKLQNKTVSSNVHVAQFENPTNSDTTIYCLWSGTADGTIKSGYQLNIPGTKAILVTPQVGSMTGKQTPLAVSGNSVKVTVTEDPIYVKVYGKATSARLEEETEAVAESLELFPNPSNGVAYISASQGQSIRSVNCIDLQGNVVKTINNPSGSIIEFNTESMAVGVYSVQIFTEGKETPTVKKFVVTR